MRRWLPVAALAAVLSPALTSTHGQAPAPAADSTIAGELAPIAWMQGTWIAQTTPPPGQVPIVIEQTVTAAVAGKALSFSTTFNGKPQYQGLFAWDPGKKAIAFWYPSAQGEITAGTVSRAQDYYLWTFQVTSPNGMVTPFQVHIKPTGPNDYDWTLLGLSGSDWKEMFSLHYKRKAS
jgi:hypothetical protein